MKILIAGEDAQLAGLPCVDCCASAVEESLMTKQSKGLLEQLMFNTITSKSDCKSLRGAFV